MENYELTGIDASIEISLKEYGFAWIKKENETIFYYGINTNGDEFIKFDSCSLNNDLDIKKEFNWIKDWDKIYSFLGTNKSEFFEFPLEYQLYELNNYYGHMNIFGETYCDALTYNEIMENHYYENS